MEDYIEILISALEERWSDRLCGEYFLQRAREEHAERALLDTLTEEQRTLFLIYEEQRNIAAVLREGRMNRQAFLLAREIFGKGGECQGCGGTGRRGRRPLRRLAGVPRVDGGRTMCLVW